MDDDRTALFDDAWLSMQARKVYRVILTGKYAAPRSVIHKVHSRMGVRGVAQLYKKLESLGVERGHDQRLRIKDNGDVSRDSTKTPERIDRKVSTAL